MTLYSFLFNALQTFSQIMIESKKRFPFVFSTINEILYVVDAFYTGKLIEPREWETCLLSMNINNIYDDYHETYDHLYPFPQFFGPCNFRNFRSSVTGDYVDNSYYLIIKKNKNYILTQHNKIPYFTPKPVKYRFLSITYKTKEENTKGEETIQIDIPDSYYIEDNELLSYLFVCRYLKHHHPAIRFDLEYTLEIVDFEFNTLSLNPNQYLLLNCDKYTVVDK